MGSTEKGLLELHLSNDAAQEKSKERAAQHSPCYANSAGPQYLTAENNFTTSQNIPHVVRNFFDRVTATGVKNMCEYDNNNLSYSCVLWVQSVSSVNNCAGIGSNVNNCGSNVCSKNCMVVTFYQCGNS
eukprot:g12003.t1